MPVVNDDAACIMQERTVLAAQRRIKQTQTRPGEGSLLCGAKTGEMDRGVQLAQSVSYVRPYLLFEGLRGQLNSKLRERSKWLRVEAIGQTICQFVISHSECKPMPSLGLWLCTSLLRSWMEERHSCPRSAAVVDRRKRTASSCPAIPW